MLWLAGRVGVERRVLVTAALACARTAWPEVRTQDRSVVQACYDTVQGWLDGTATMTQVRHAAYAAYAAANYAAAYADGAAAAVAGAAAAYAAAYAADAAAADAAAAYAAAYAAGAAAYAAAGADAAAAYAADAAAAYAAYAYAAGAAAARSQRLRECADFVRQHIPEPPQLEGRRDA
jgi:hypothetical protein